MAVWLNIHFTRFRRAAGDLSNGLSDGIKFAGQMLFKKQDIRTVYQDIGTHFYKPYLLFRLSPKVNPGSKSCVSSLLKDSFTGGEEVRMIVLFRDSQAAG